MATRSKSQRFGGERTNNKNLQVKNGHIRRVIDDEVKSLVLDIGGTNVATTYITCPIKPRASLGVKLPYLVMIIKNMKKYFSFEIQILDDKDMRRRFRVSNFQSTTKVRPFCTTMPIGLSSGWNQVQFNLADFTKRAYGSVYMETVRVQIHANVRIRRIYFTDQLHSDEDLPNEFKLFAPGPKDQKTKSKESKKPSVILEAAAVPPLMTEPKADEEVPPPPSPAEESPLPKEETGLDSVRESVMGDEREAVAEEGVVESPSAVIEGEAPPLEEGAEVEPSASKQLADSAPPASKQALTAESASKQVLPEASASKQVVAAQSVSKQGLPAEGGMVASAAEVKTSAVEVAEQGEGEALVAEGEAIREEGQEAPPEEAVEVEPIAEEGGEAPVEEAPTETTADEGTTEYQTESVAETTEVTTEVTSEVTGTEPPETPVEEDV